MRYTTALRRAVVAPVAVLTALATGCAEAEPIIGAEHQPAEYARYDGETLFQGIVLGTGAAASALPELWQNPAVDRARSDRSVEQLAEQAQLQQFILESIRDTDPGFFDRFRAAVTSGSHVQVRTAMDGAGDVVASALMRHPNPKVRAAVTGRTGDVVRNAETNCLLVLVIVAYAAVAVWDWKWGPDEEVVTGEMSGLKEDQLVHLIATRLQTQIQ